MGYYVSPRFLDKLAIHITKNFIDFPGVRVPLILGIHGKKGEGKSFQCELVFQKMGIEPVRMSSGELESPDAGDPVRLIRMRYREAAELVRVRGKMCVLLINDLDAGAGRVDPTTQYTVNTQLVNGTLMNIADNPTDVQLPGSYETEPIQRVPIIVTGNDFSTLYAPLVRDGRMDKFYWEPSRSDRVGIVRGIFEADHLPANDVEQLVDYFQAQSIDFFGALRSRLYDQQVRQFIKTVGLSQISTLLVNSTRQTMPIQAMTVTLPHLIELGNALVQENQKIHQSRLAQAYVVGKAIAGETSSLGRDRSAQKNFSRQSRENTGVPVQYLQETVHQKTATNSTQNTRLPSHLHEGKIVQSLDWAILQGGTLRLEIAHPREKAANVWRTWSWPATPTNSSMALEGIQTCLSENPDCFIKLIGYNPQTQTRLMEELIVRPS